MKPFPPVTLTFKDEDYEVPPEKVWGLIGTIENVVSRGKLAIRLADQDPPETKIAEAYAAALTYAGRKTGPQEIMVGATIEDAINNGLVLFNILSIAAMPDDVDASSEEQEPGKTKPGKARKK